MLEIIQKIIPNVASHPERFFNGLLETFVMTLWYLAMLCPAIAGQLELFLESPLL